MNIVIVGAGASGITAAIHASYNKNNNITLIERNNVLGKKILATGNGKCNFTNKNLHPKKYSNGKFVTPTLSTYGYREIIE